MTLKRKTPLKSSGFKKKDKTLLKTVKGYDPAIIDKLKAKGLVRSASSLTAKRKPSGQKELFERIWNERPHVCQVCGAPIREARAGSFSHNLPKGSYPEYKLDPRNITILCSFDGTKEGCHELFHAEGSLLRARPEWAGVFRSIDELRSEAAGQ